MFSCASHFPQTELVLLADISVFVLLILVCIINELKPYFLGSIIFKSGKTPNTWDHFSDCKIVIDGQQRLTTLMIFFKVLCLKKNENRLFERDFRLEDDTIVLQHGRNDISAFDTVMRQDKL